MTPSRKPKPAKPPSGLSPEARAWWRSVDATWALEDHKLKMLGMAAECIDRAASGRASIQAHGAIVLDRFGVPKANPAIKIEHDAKLLFTKIVRELNLADAPDDARPPRLHPQLSKG